ncbi:hypothetical protein [Dactylosporangium sp. CA-139066]|uniref:hypothetical protein n=1 Tax=Dactylosporangium sp. CA-139066 TaxID=3239930 RepID=UPI003D8BC031
MTVRNTGSGAVDDVSVRVLLDFTLATSGDCPIVPIDPGGNDQVNRCHIDTLAPGAVRTFTLRYEWTADEKAGLNGHSGTYAALIFGDRLVASYDQLQVRPN